MHGNGWLVGCGGGSLFSAACVHKYAHKYATLYISSVVRTYLNMYVASVAPFGLKVHSRSESPAVIALGILHACRVLNCDKSVLEVERADLFILGAKQQYFAFALRSNSSVASWYRLVSYFCGGTTN